MTEGGLGTAFTPLTTLTAPSRQRLPLLGPSPCRGYKGPGRATVTLLVSCPPIMNQTKVNRRGRLLHHHYLTSAGVDRIFGSEQFERYLGELQLASMMQGGDPQTPPTFFDTIGDPSFVESLALSPKLFLKRLTAPPPDGMGPAQQPAARHLAGISTLCTLRRGCSKCFIFSFLNHFL